MSWEFDNPRPGYWMAKCCRFCPPVAARIWWEQTTVDPDSGEPMERSPFLAAQLGLDIVSWPQVWALVEYLESTPEQRQEIVSPGLSARPPRQGRRPGLLAPPMPKWQQERARRISMTEYLTELEWLSWAARNQPKHPEFTYRRALDPRTVPPPRFL